MSGNRGYNESGLFCGSLKLVCDCHAVPLSGRSFMALELESLIKNKTWKCNCSSVRSFCA